MNQRVGSERGQSDKSSRRNEKGRGPIIMRRGVEDRGRIDPMEQRSVCTKRSEMLHFQSLLTTPAFSDFYTPFISSYLLILDLIRLLSTAYLRFGSAPFLII